MPSAKLVLPIVAIAFAAGACGKAVDHATDSAVAATPTSTPAPSASAATPAPTLTPAAAETAKPSPAAAQSGAARSTTTSPPPAPRATPAAADTAKVRIASAAPVADTTRSPKPAAAPPAGAQTVPSQPPAGAAATAPVVPDSLGKPAYDANCRRCHGVRGVPPRTMAAKYPRIPTFDAAFVAKVSADSIVSVLDRGVNDDMKSFKDKLTRDEMRAVAAYLRAFAR